MQRGSPNKSKVINHFSYIIISSKKEYQNAVKKMNELEKRKRGTKKGTSKV